MGQLENRITTVAEAADRLLQKYGHIETSDSARTVYTDGDMNVAREAGIVEVIFRGTLVFRYGPELPQEQWVFEEHGPWSEIVELATQIVPDDIRDDR